MKYVRLVNSLNATQYSELCLHCYAKSRFFIVKTIEIAFEKEFSFNKFTCIWKTLTWRDNFFNIVCWKFSSHASRLRIILWKRNVLSFLSFCSINTYVSSCTSLCIVPLRRAYTMLEQIFIIVVSDNVTKGNVRKITKYYQCLRCFEREREEKKKLYKFHCLMLCWCSANGIDWSRSKKKKNNLHNSCRYSHFDLLQFHCFRKNIYEPNGGKRMKSNIIFLRLAMPLYFVP